VSDTAQVELKSERVQAPTLAQSGRSATGRSLTVPDLASSLLLCRSVRPAGCGEATHVIACRCTPPTNAQSVLDDVASKGLGLRV